MLTSYRKQRRTRRVKCDETKPNCLRCIAFKIKCDGYPKPVSSLGTIRNRSLHPKLYPKLLAMPSSALRFADELEERYFRRRARWHLRYNILGPIAHASLSRGAIRAEDSHGTERSEHLKETITPYQLSTENCTITARQAELPSSNIKKH